MSFAVAGTLGRIGSRVIRGRQRFYLDFRPRGSVWALPNPAGGRALPFTEETARRALEAIRAEVACGKTLAQALAPWLAKRSEEQLVLVQAARWLEQLRTRCEAGDLSPTYIKEISRYIRDRGYWAGWWKKRAIHGIRYADLEDWAAWLAKDGGARGEGLSPKSRQHVIAAFRSFLRWLRRRGEIAEGDVPEFPTIEVPEHAPQVLDRATQQKVLDAIPWEERGGFLAARLGVRPGEVRAADVDDYKEDDRGLGWLTIRRATKGELASAPIRGTKEGNVRTLPCDGQLQEWIRARLARLTNADVLAGRTALFENPIARNRTRRWTGNKMRRRWNRACEAVGVRATLYSGTKHSFATHLRESGVPLDAIQELLGHADRRSTERYAKLRSPALAELIRMHLPKNGSDR